MPARRPLRAGALAAYPTGPVIEQREGPAAKEDLPEEWHSQRDSNPCLRRERAVSLASRRWEQMAGLLGLEPRTFWARTRCAADCTTAHQLTERWKDRPVPSHRAESITVQSKKTVPRRATGVYETAPKVSTRIPGGRRGITGAADKAPLPAGSGPPSGPVPGRGASRRGRAHGPFR